MYNIINKENFNIGSVEKLSPKCNDEWAVLDSSIILYTETIDEETGESIGTPIYNSKYIDTLEFNGTVPYKKLEYMKCVNIVLYEGEELAAILAEEAAEEALKTFGGKSVKIEGDYDYLVDKYSNLVLYALGKPSVKKHVNGGATILVDYVKTPHYNQMKSDANITLTTFDGSAVTNFLI